MKYLYAFLATLIVLAVFDVILLNMGIASTFNAELGESAFPSPRMLPAVIFTCCMHRWVMVSIVLLNLLLPSAWHIEFLFGAIRGLIAYATYDFSNMATLKAWSWKLTIIDLAWATFVPAVSVVADRVALMSTS